MFVRNQMASCYWKISLSGRGWEEAGERFLFPGVERKILWGGHWDCMSRHCPLQRAITVQDFANKRQSDSVKVVSTKLSVYNLAIFLFSLFQNFPVV